MKIGDFIVKNAKIWEILIKSVKFWLLFTKTRFSGNDADTFFSSKIELGPAVPLYGI